MTRVLAIALALALAACQSQRFVPSCLDRDLPGNVPCRR